MSGKSYHQALDLFDRKERSWLVRQCVGERSQLGQPFCDRLAETFGTPPPPITSWWATDYHLDFLAGASKWHQGYTNEVHEDNVTGTIGDIDLIIAAPNHLYLIEAKNAGSWSNKQLGRKTAQIAKLCPGGKLNFLSDTETVRVHFGLFSLGRAKRVETSSWPRWMLNNNEPYVVQSDTGRQRRLRVQQVNAKGELPVKWTIVGTKY